MSAVDLFAGARGWEAGSAIDAIGIELDPWACRTSAAAGLATIRADVTKLDPVRFAGFDGLIASPPCPSFSSAGNRTGLADMPRLHAVIAAAARDGWTGAGEGWLDPRTPLVLDVLRWVLGMRPMWIACEQVPEVLPIWQHMAMVFEGLGYRCWTGVLSAERYGVPQVRRRAVLMARRDRPVSPPGPTHRGYDVRRKAHEPPDLFDLPQAPNAFDGPASIDRRQMSNGPGGSRVSVVLVEGGERPAPTLTATAGEKGQWLANRPAPTVCGNRAPAWWYVDNGPRDAAGARLIRRTNQGDGKGGHVPAPDIDLSERPAPTLMTGPGKWLVERPATTVCGDASIAAPGHHDGPQMAEATTLTIAEAARLQSFPDDWPWQGNRTAVFRQIGNAIPPLLAAAILRELT